MKKQILTAIIAMIPAMSFAKISDFDGLITENAKIQQDLHSKVKHSINGARNVVANSNVRERIVIVENSGQSYNSPTSKNMMAFKKEKTFHRASEEKNFDRLATEISSLND